ncbi:TetR/AcrR family transcriptional regulator [Frondihabitans cladoniiphilus]|uniref:TetR/AcrR family transcriptional regulator n=1 Tax=Frondihabitans cladoniiphilus TaxID=715785 RepID=A0ABP8VU49_9MICO
MTTSTEPEHRALRRDASENRRRLIEAARLVFAEHGMEAGVEEVAHRAGVGVGTLYRRFPTKDALIAELVRTLLDEVLESARQASTVPGGDGLEHFLFDVGAAHAANRGCLARLWNDETTTTLRQEIRTRMATLLDDARRHGRIRDDATIADVDLTFWSLRGVLEASGHDLPDAWRRQVAISVAGLRPSAEALSQPALA